MAGVVVLLVAGCAGRQPYLQTYVQERPVQACRIGVLPLINQSSYKQGETLMYRLLLSGLINERTWSLALEGDVRKIYRDMHLRPWRQQTPDQLRVLASRLEVDLLIGGRIIEMKEEIKGGGIDPRLKVEVQVYNGRDGTLLWSTYHGRKGADYRKLMHFGLRNTVSELGQKMIEEILRLWEEEGLLACAD